MHSKYLDLCKYYVIIEECSSNLSSKKRLFAEIETITESYNRRPQNPENTWLWYAHPQIIPLQCNLHT